MGYTKKAKAIAADQKYSKETFMCSKCHAQFGSYAKMMLHKKDCTGDYHTMPGLGLFSGGVLR